MSNLIEMFANHPIAQAIRSYAEAQKGEDENNFTPPIDVFSTPAAYVLHVALPGAKKEDVGVNWDAEKNELNVAGVVYRQGDEEFLKTLSKKERKVGAFERSIKLPPGEDEKEEVDSDNITAKLEDGVLIVTVPKVEKEWTEVKKVDIE
jgi:HSP20 family protein